MSVATMSRHVWRPEVIRPLKTRLRNRFGWLSWNKPDLSLDWIKNKAEELSGFSNWGDQESLLNLEALLESYRRESACPLEARREFQSHMVHYGMQRLDMINLLSQHPEIEEIPVEQPIFIAGLPRTGTTLLHRLVSADPNNRPLLFWESQDPLPVPDPETHQNDPRINHMKDSLARLYQMAPGLRAIHSFEADAPDECCPLFIRAFSSLAFPVMYHMPTFAKYARELDMRASYRFHKQQLQMLSWKFPKKRWVLKEPSHLIYLDALLDVYPDAQIILTHRNPLNVVASYCSLGGYHRAISSHGANANPRELGAQQLELLCFGWNRAVQLRQKLDPKRIYDISYHRLTADPIAQIHQIYDYFGQAWSEEVTTAMRDWLQANRKHKHGSHNYTLEQFGLNEEAVRRAFAPYYREYGGLIRD